MSGCVQPFKESLELPGSRQLCAPFRQPQLLCPFQGLLALAFSQVRCLQKAYEGQCIFPPGDSVILQRGTESLHPLC